MGEPAVNDVTVLLAAVRAGDARARQSLVDLVYEELRRLAGGLMRRERADHTLQPTALVHEAFMRLLRDDAQSRWENRRHFFGAASEAMRRILVDHARGRAAEKRVGDAHRVPLDDFLVVFEDNMIDLLSLDQALTELAELQPRQYQIINLYFFLGLMQKEIGDLCAVSHTTVEHDLRKAKAWLRRRLAGRANDA